MNYEIAELRAAWLMGALTGSCAGVAWAIHSWEPLLLGAMGLYGLFDVKRANARLRQREEAKRREHP